MEYTTTANNKAAKSRESCLVMEMKRKMRFQEKVNLFEKLSKAGVGTREISSIDSKIKKKLGSRDSLKDELINNITKIKLKDAVSMKKSSQE